MGISVFQRLRLMFVDANACGFTGLLIQVLGLAVFGIFTVLECVVLLSEKPPKEESWQLAPRVGEIDRPRSLHEDTTLPKYNGPARVGTHIPPFTTTFADGRAFTDKDLEEGTPTVLVFFRGRW
jgi:hypothetical protein